MSERGRAPQHNGWADWIAPPVGSEVGAHAPLEHDDATRDSADEPADELVDDGLLQSTAQLALEDGLAAQSDAVDSIGGSDD